MNSYVATVLLESESNVSNSKRFQALSEITQVISNKLPKDGVIVFPGGWYEYDAKNINEALYNELYYKAKQTLKDIKSNIIISYGIDGIKNKRSIHQLAIALSKDKIEAIGRKFCPTSYEKDFLVLAKDCIQKEKSFDRIFKFHDRKFFLGICYDSFGIKKQHLMNPGVNVILNHVHGFYPKGEGNSGEVYFAKHGFAGASKEWDCPVFASAIFFRRTIPENWPTGVMWNQGNMSTTKWCYDKNPISPDNKLLLETSAGRTIINIFKL